MEEWEDEEEAESEEMGSDVDEEPHLATITHERRKSAKVCRTRLSVIEYERFLESVRVQVSFALVDQHVASNRGKRVFRKVLEEMFRERIEEA